MVEYLNVPSATGQPAYTVSFQIVLYADGRFGLNYLHAPDGAPPRMTAGIQTQDGRYFNQLACVTSVTEAERRAAPTNPCFSQRICSDGR